jgi:UDP-glucose 4-epimerase
MEAVAAFEKACGHPIAYKIGPRRAGDIATCYASADLAAAELGWRATKTLDEACQDAWRWQSQNPQGFRQ